MPLAIRLAALLLFFAIVAAENPYRFFTWNVTYGTIYPLDVPQQGILINGQFPGPDIYSVTNDNIIVNVFNSLDEPFLIHWKWTKAIGTFLTYSSGEIVKIQFKEMDKPKWDIGRHGQSTSSGPGRRSSKHWPVTEPESSYGRFIGPRLRSILDGGNKLPFPDGILINGRGPNVTSFTVQQGKTYRFRVCNVGLQNSLNFRIQSHKMKVVEVEGTHTVQVSYSSLDIHLGQCMSVLVTADQQPKDYVFLVSSRFTNPVLTTRGFLRYAGSNGPSSDPLPGGPTTQIDWSLNQARSIRTFIEIVFENPEDIVQSYHLSGYSFFVVG
ncbi:SKU5-similar 6 [Striga hermonthica]|uniref:SKU5-similar 6 n=1 Tax=Striga hermonthica TaxID=68872 RepID=A0A9N7MX50_STRHE|nr:SKU5-similar 6 [Striga hermonthica]